MRIEIADAPDARRFPLATLSWALLLLAAQFLLAVIVRDDVHGGGSNSVSVQAPAVQPGRARFNWGWVPWVALAGILTAFMWLYGSMILNLPIFGDAANHARISRSFLDRGFWDTLTPYPPLYHLLGAFALAVGGETGFRLLTVLGLGALGVSLYLFSREVSRSTVVALLTVLVALMSMEILFFTARMYMEIVLSASVVMALFLAHRYFRLRTTGSLLWLAMAVGIAALIKQQGLVLLMPAVAIYLTVEAGVLWVRGDGDRAGTTARHLALYVLVAALVAGPAMLWQFRSTGHVLPDTEYTAWLNNAGQWLTGYEEEQAAWREQWDDRLNPFFLDNYAERGFERAEARHIRPHQVFTTPRGFFSIHSLYWYPTIWQYPVAANLLMLSLVALGLVVWIWRSWRQPFFWFFLAFLAINYAAFVRNTDQVRYHLYIAAALTFVIPYGVAVLMSRWRVASTVALAALGVFALALAASYIPARVDKARNFALTQAYAPSVGGIASVEEVSLWLDEHLSPGETFYALPTTEFQYYSGREGVFDYRIYFLPREELRALFDDMGVRYIVIPESTIVPNEQWNHILWGPQSFIDNLRSLYPVVCPSSSGDIWVFQVKSSTQASSGSTSAETSGCGGTADVT